MRKAAYLQDDRRERIIARNRARRSRELQNHIIVICVTVCLVVLFSIFLGSFLSEAKEKANSSDKVKCFKSVMVMYGETLDDVAEKYFDENAYAGINDYTDEILRINSLPDTEGVRPGQYVVIPYFETVH